MKPRVKLPESIKTGEVIEIKTLISHPMETGLRKDKDGNAVPRNIIHTFAATFDGQPVFRASLMPGISANPFVSFTLRVPAKGELVLSWTDDAGVTVIEKVAVTAVG